ncbi:hypothetical protein B0H11DRAFT_1741215, partial [Mycena galericulata]
VDPKQFKVLKMARVDCHLIHGCEVSPDCAKDHVRELCGTRVDFLRQILNVLSHSMVVVLFTETRIMPLRIRHFLLLLAYLEYLLSLKLPLFARASLNSSIELAATGKNHGLEMC